jgi:biotin carboxyl carrier protein
MSVDATRADACSDPEPRHEGETLAVPDRLVVAPGVGRFHPTIDARRARHVRRGEQIGVLEGPRSEVVVRSPFAGEVMGLLAWDGERVRSGEPLLWLRVS